MVNRLFRSVVVEGQNDYSFDSGFLHFTKPMLIDITFHIIYSWFGFSNILFFLVILFVLFPGPTTFVLHVIFPLPTILTLSSNPSLQFSGTYYSYRL